MKTDRFLWATLIAIALLVIASLALFFLRRENQAYSLEETPQAAVRNYVLALEKRDYRRAYDLLQDAPGKPSFERFQQDFLTRIIEPSRAALAIRETNISDGQAVVELVVIFSGGGLFADTYRQIESALLVRDQAGKWKISRMPYPFWGYDWYSPARP